MSLDYTRKNSDKRVDVFEIIHIVLGILIFIITIVAFINPEKNIKLFAVSFFLISLLFFINLVFTYSIRQRGKRNWKAISLCLARLLAAGLVTALVITIVL